MSKSNQANSLVWNLGYIRTLVRLGIDPTDVLNSIYDKYKHNEDFVTQLESGEKFAIKMNKKGQYKHNKRIEFVDYEGNTD